MERAKLTTWKGLVEDRTWEKELYTGEYSPTGILGEYSNFSLHIETLYVQCTCYTAAEAVLERKEFIT